MSSHKNSSEDGAGTVPSPIQQKRAARNARDRSGDAERLVEPSPIVAEQQGPDSAQMLQMFQNALEQQQIRSDQKALEQMQAAERRAADAETRHREQMASMQNLYSASIQSNLDINSNIETLIQQSSQMRPAGGQAAPQNAGGAAATAPPPAPENAEPTDYSLVPGIPAILEKYSQDQRSHMRKFFAAADANKRISGLQISVDPSVDYPTGTPISSIPKFQKPKVHENVLETEAYLKLLLEMETNHRAYVIVMTKQLATAKELDAAYHEAKLAELDTELPAKFNECFLADSTLAPQVRQGYLTKAIADATKRKSDNQIQIDAETAMVKTKKSKKKEERDIEELEALHSPDSAILGPIMDKKLEIFAHKFQLGGAGAGGGPAPMNDQHADGADKALNVELDAGVTKLAKQQAPKNGPVAGKSSRRQNKKGNPGQKKKK
jgi:hypothetical protein